MLSVWAGLPIGFLGFLLVTNFISHVVGSGIPLIIGLFAGWLIWRYFQMLDDKRLASMLASGDQVWTVPLPMAWGIIKDVFDGSLLVAGSGNVTRWILEKEDQVQGVLVAMLTFREHIGAERSTVTADNTIRVTASIKHHQSGTIASFRYEILTGCHNAVIERIIASTNSEIATELELRSAAFK